MIINLESTDISTISKTLLELREQGGAVTLGRVLTLVISTNSKDEETVITAANNASREHPMRIIVISKHAKLDSAPLSPSLPHSHAQSAIRSSLDEQNARIDAQIRVGAHAGAGEVIILHSFGSAAYDEESLITGLILPDTPIVVWWPTHAPDNPAQSVLGSMATRRITDCSTDKNPPKKLQLFGKNYIPGDTDLSWTRLTPWRTQLAAALDQPPYTPVLSVEIVGSMHCTPVALMTYWLQRQLQVPITNTQNNLDDTKEDLSAIRLIRQHGVIELKRIDDRFVCLTQPDHPTHNLSFPRPSLSDCLAEELRRLDSDDVYGSVVTCSTNVSMQNH